MSISNITIANITSIIMMACLFVNIFRGKDYVYQDVKAISTISLLVIIESILEIIASSSEGIRSLIWLNYLASSIMFIINVFICFGWLVFIYVKLYGALANVSKPKLLLTALPGIAVSVLSVANLFTPVFFTITSDNRYQRTDYYVISVVSAVFYLGYGFILFELKKKKNKRYDFYPVLSFMLPVVIFQIIQIVFDSLSLTALSIAIGVCTVYMSVKNELSYVDSLSGAFNKTYFDRSLISAVKARKKNKRLAGFMIDIDKFKSINDTHGHLVGDDAIKSAAKILINTSKHFKNNLYVFRYGGDEFIVLQWITSEDELVNNQNAIIDATKKFNESGEKPYQINFSIGSAIYDVASDNAEDFIARMDKAMYEDKQRKIGQ